MPAPVLYSAYRPSSRPSSTDDPLIGATLKDTYRIDRLLAKGGMGAVYAACHLRLGRPFAVKVFLESYRADADLLARFQKEARTLARLNHPNIVQVLDVDETPEKIPYMVMEYLEGETLGSRLRHHGPMPVVGALRIVADLATALAHVHDHGIVHCDLKPANVFLLRLGPQHDFVKMLDFGVSMEVLSRRLDGHRVIGTPGYMTPEQIRGDGELDGRVDQFALALIAYEMLSGKTAFPGAEPSAVMSRVQYSDPPPLAEAAPWIPSALDVVLRRALSKNPDARYPTISRFAWALTNAAIDAGIDTENRSPSPVLGSRYRSATPRTSPPPCPNDSVLPTRAATPVRMSAATPDTVPITRPKSARAGDLVRAAQESLEMKRLDEAVAHAEGLFELAVYEGDALVLKTLASAMPLLERIFETRVGPPHARLVAAAITEQLRTELSPRAAQVLACADEPRRAEAILRACGIPRREGVRLIAGLMRRGALVVSSPE